MEQIADKQNTLDLSGLSHLAYDALLDNYLKILGWLTQNCQASTLVLYTMFQLC